VEGGYYRWVQRAFGPFWAFQNGWCTWVYSLLDMAIYPVLFNQYLAWFVPDLSSAARWAISLLVIWGATLVNLRGAGRVGQLSVAAGVFVLGAFAAMALVALPRASGVPWEPFLKPGGDVLGGAGVGLSIALWNYIGWDNASTALGEVRDGGRAYPRALAMALPLVTLGYLIPLLPALAATDWSTWRDGGWPDIAVAAGGAWGPLVASWLAVAGMVSAVALFNALLLAYSRIPLALAKDGFLPVAIGRTSAHGVPRNAVLAAAVCYSIFALLPFKGLVVADVLLYSFALSLEFGALVALRRSEPGLRGSFRLPFGWQGVAALTVLPLAVLLLVIVLGVQDGEYGLPAILLAVGAAALGPLVYRWADRGRLGRLEAAQGVR